MHSLSSKFCLFLPAESIFDYNFLRRHVDIIYIYKRDIKKGYSNTYGIQCNKTSVSVFIGLSKQNCKEKEGPRN